METRRQLQQVSKKIDVSTVTPAALLSMIKRPQSVFPKDYHIHQCAAVPSSGRDGEGGHLNPGTIATAQFGPRHGQGSAPAEWRVSVLGISEAKYHSGALSYIPMKIQ